jgi:hypothetical protein
MPEDENQIEVKEEKEAKEELSGDEIFDKAFDEIIAKEVIEEGETPPPDKEFIDDEKAPKEEQIIQEGEEGVVPPPEEKVQPPVEEKAAEPPPPPPKEAAKAPEPPPPREEREERPPERKKEPPPDYSLLFKDIERDISDETLKKELAEYETDMDAVSKFEGIKRELVAKRVVNYVNESFKVLIDRLQPFMEASAKSIEKGHFATIEANHKDFRELRDSGEVINWIKEHPRYMQKPMIDTYERGDAEDVVDLLTRYKTDKGLLKKEEPPPVHDEKKEEAQRKIDEKIKNLSAVRTKNAPIHVSDKKQAAGAEDFEGAFDEASSFKRK